jgi:hypothetical protein
MSGDSDGTELASTAASAKRCAEAQMMVRPARRSDIEV